MRQEPGVTSLSPDNDDLPRAVFRENVMLQSQQNFSSDIFTVASFQRSESLATPRALIDLCPSLR